jgi:hypothetical protein
LAPALLAVHEHEHESDPSPLLLDGLDGLEGGIPCGDDVIDDDHGSGSAEIALNAAAAAVAFGFLADGKGLDGRFRGSHGGGHGEREGERIRAEGEAANRGGSDAETGGLFQEEGVEQAADQKGTAGVKGGDAAVNVEVALFAGGQGKGAGFDGFGEQQRAEFGAVGVGRHGTAWFRRERAEGKRRDRKRKAEGGRGLKIAKT